MTEETAKQLAEAMNRLAAAIERAAPGGLGGGLHIYHHGLPHPVQPFYPQPGYYPLTNPVWSGVGNITGGNS